MQIDGAVSDAASVGVNKNLMYVQEIIVKKKDDVNPLAALMTGESWGHYNPDEHILNSDCASNVPDPKDTEYSDKNQDFARLGDESEDALVQKLTKQSIMAAFKLNLGTKLEKKENNLRLKRQDTRIDLIEQRQKERIQNEKDKEYDKLRKEREDEETNYRGASQQPLLRKINKKASSMRNVLPGTLTGKNMSSPRVKVSVNVSIAYTETEGTDEEQGQNTASGKRLIKHKQNISSLSIMSSQSKQSKMEPAAKKLKPTLKQPTSFPVRNIVLQKETSIVTFVDSPDKLEQPTEGDVNESENRDAMDGSFLRMVNNKSPINMLSPVYLGTPKMTALKLKSKPTLDIPKTMKIGDTVAFKRQQKEKKIKRGSSQMTPDYEKNKIIPVGSYRSEIKHQNQEEEQIKLNKQNTGVQKIPFDFTYQNMIERKQQDLDLKNQDQLTLDLALKLEEMAGILNKNSAARIKNNILTNTKASAKKTTIKHTLPSIHEDVFEGTLTSSKHWEQLRTKDFNPEMDVYSDHPSVLVDTHHHLNKSERLLSRLKNQPMDSVENSLEEEESLDSEDREEQEKALERRKENQQRLQENIEKYNVAQALRQKKDMQKEQKELVGARLLSKVDIMLDPYKRNAGLPGLESIQEELLSPTTPMFQRMASRLVSDRHAPPSNANDKKAHQNNVIEFEEGLKDQLAFFQLAKVAEASKYAEVEDHGKVRYLKECLKDKSVIVPFLNKIIENALLIRDTKITSGQAKGLQGSMMINTNLISKLYLDDNNLDGSQLCTILNGLNYQQPCKYLAIQSNQLDLDCIEEILILLKRRHPNHLDELHLMFTQAKTSWDVIEELCVRMNGNHSLRKLSLVDVGLNQDSINDLTKVVQNAKALISLDLSWNSLLPQHLKGMLQVLSLNRKLHNLNLSWNSISDAQASEKEQQSVGMMIGKLIKHSRTMQHIDLTGTGLGTYVIKAIGNALRKSRALMCIHLSGNPGLTRQNMGLIERGCKTRDNEDISRFIRIDHIMRQAVKEDDQQHTMLDAMKAQINRRHDLTLKKGKKDPIADSPADKLILQRFLGHREEQPGSAQWYHSSTKGAFRTHLKGQKERRDCSDEDNEKPYMENIDEALAYMPHYKSNCWMCQGHIYTIFFWSKGMAYKLNPIYDKTKSQILSYEIDRDFAENQDDSYQKYQNGQVKYEDQEDQVPFLAGSFTGWRYLKMQSLEDLNRSLDEYPRNILSVCQQAGQIRKYIKQDMSRLNEWEQRHYDIALLEERMKYQYGHKEYLMKSLRFKKPYLVNAYEFEERPSPDGTLPQDPLTDETLYPEGPDPELLSDTSDEVETNDEMTRRSSLCVSAQSFDTDTKNKKKEDEEYRKANPFAHLPDASRFDKVFILPLFCKPGKHQYMIKYKDTKEQKQKYLIEKINKYKKRRAVAKKGQVPHKPYDKIKHKEAETALRDEVFFYKCDIPVRTEEVPTFAKTMRSTVIERVFDKEHSVFAQWRTDTQGLIDVAFADDMKAWKGYRFIKDEEDKKATEDVLKQHYVELKDIFTNLISRSEHHPGISSIDFSDFAVKSKFLDGAVVNLAALDRGYIGATLKMNANDPPNMIRFEFLEILVRLAEMRYIQTKKVKTYKEATELIIKECLLPNWKAIEPWQEFRNKQLWTVEINDMLSANLSKLHAVYNHFLDPLHKAMDLKDCRDLMMKNIDKHPMGVKEPDVIYAYGMCKMTVINELSQYKAYSTLEFVEFLEFLARITTAKYRHSPIASEVMTLVNMMEETLDDIFEMMKIGPRVEVKIEIEEISESDDDY